MHKKTYFASDFHLGVDTAQETSRQREEKIIRWLDAIMESCDALYLVGDVFDYWFEYNYVVPKGYSRFLGKLAQFTDAGIPLYIFSGNHDMWLKEYLEKEIGANIIHEPIQISINNSSFYIAHGDGLGPGDRGYKFIKWVFRNPVNQWLFSLLHPTIGIYLMRYFSGLSRAHDGDHTQFDGPDGEWLIQHCEEVLKEDHIDHFIFGHRHLPIDYTLSNGSSRYINLGDMISLNTFASFDGQNLNLEIFENTDTHIFGN